MSEDLMRNIVWQLLDWPFLLFLGCVIVVFLFKDQLGSVLARGGITLVWGEKSFSITELPEELDESFSITADDIEILNQRIKKIEKQLVDSPANEGQIKVPPPDRTAARDRMLKALAEGKYRWRSIERLATIGGVSNEDAASILQPLKEVVFGRGNSGRTITRLSVR